MTKLYNLAADWEERAQMAFDKLGNQAPVQAANARDIMRMCAKELRDELEKGKVETKQP
jgi:hypothetical protein